MPIIDLRISWLRTGASVVDWWVDRLQANRVLICHAGYGDGNAERNASGLSASVFLKLIPIILEPHSFSVPKVFSKTHPIAIYFWVSDNTPLKYGWGLRICYFLFEQHIRQVRFHCINLLNTYLFFIIVAKTTGQSPGIISSWYLSHTLAIPLSPWLSTQRWYIKC